MKVRDLVEGAMPVKADVLVKQCEDAMDLLDRAQQAYGRIMDSVVRGVDGVDLGGGDQKMLLRAMNAELAEIAGAHDRAAKLLKMAKK